MAQAGGGAGPSRGAAPPELDVLRDEYKVIQDKLDKIGDFRFKVKGAPNSARSLRSLGYGA